MEDSCLNFSLDPMRYFRKYQLQVATCKYLVGDSASYKITRCYTVGCIFFLIKGALTSFGFMCKIIARLSQSRLLYVPATFQGLKTNRTRATINFLGLFKAGNYFCGIVVCDVVVRWQRFEKLFAMARTSIYKTMAPVWNVTDVVIFKMSKDCHSALATFGRRTPLVAEAW